MTSEAKVVLHNRARWRRLSQAHLTFSSLLLLHHSPSGAGNRKDFSHRIFDADQTGHNLVIQNIARLRIRKLVHKGGMRCPISEPHSLDCIAFLAPWSRTPGPQPLSGPRQLTFCRGAHERREVCRRRMANSMVRHRGSVGHYADVECAYAELERCLVLSCNVGRLAQTAKPPACAKAGGESVRQSARSYGANPNTRQFANCDLHFVGGNLSKIVDTF